MVRCPSERETLAPVSFWSQSAPAEPSEAPLQEQKQRTEGHKHKGDEEERGLLETEKRETE